MDQLEKTGLTWPKSWRGVYFFVLVTFVAWVILLSVLSLSFNIE